MIAGCSFGGKPNTDCFCNPYFFYVQISKEKVLKWKFLRRNNWLKKQV